MHICQNLVQLLMGLTTAIMLMLKTAKCWGSKHPETTCTVRQHCLSPICCVGCRLIPSSLASLIVSVTRSFDKLSSCIRLPSPLYMSKPCMYTPGIGAPILGKTFLHHGPLALPVAIHTCSSIAEPSMMQQAQESEMYILKALMLGMVSVLRVHCK